MNHFRSSASPSVDRLRGSVRIARLAASIERGAGAQAARPSPAYSGCRSRSATTRCTRPSSRASVGLSGRPSRIISSAREAPRSCERRWVPPPPGAEAERHLGEPDHLGLGGHVAEVAGERDLAGAAQRRAVDRRDEDLVHALHAGQDVVHPLQLEEARGGRSPQRRTRPGQSRDAADGLQGCAGHPGGHASARRPRSP